MTRRRLQAVLGYENRAGPHGAVPVCVAAACAISLSVAGLLPTIVIVGAGAAVALAHRRRSRAQQVTETQIAVVDLCRATAAELRAGHASARAFASAADAAPLRLAVLLRTA
ncbi:MAG TPA: hypothetical protein VGD55_10780, partial [Acidothermaceae bacterium]